MSEEIKTLFNEISPTYDALNHLLSFGIDKRWRKKSLDKISNDKNSPLFALDLCAGTLDLSLEFLRQYPRAKVVALDFAQSMLRLGQKKISPSIQKRLYLVCGDGLSLPFPPSLFDVVFCAYGMRNLDDNSMGLKGISEVLKKKGQLFILEFFRPVKWTTKIFHEIVGRFWLPFMGGLVSGKGEAYSYLYNSIQGFYSLDEYQKLLFEEGFSHVGGKHFLLGISSLATGDRL